MKTKRFRSLNVPAIGAAVIAVILAALLGWSETQRQREHDKTADCIRAVSSFGHLLDAISASSSGDSL